VHEHHQCFISQFCDLANVVTSIGRFFLISRTSGPNFDIKFFLVGSLGEAWFFKFLTLCSSNYLSKIQKRSACLSKEPNPLFKIFVEGFGFDFNSSKRVVSWSCLVSASPKTYGFRRCSRQNWNLKPLGWTLQIGEPTNIRANICKKI
jgi:hypothetical protein